MMANLDNAAILKAMKAECIPAGWSGLWFVQKGEIAEPTTSNRYGKGVVVPPGVYTHLIRVTESHLHLWPPGEVVMEDTPFELRTHLGFVRRAFGRVLVTGLGLGCVVRGLLVNPRVKHVTVIENSPDVLSLVASHIPQSRVEIVEAEAFRWAAHNKQTFDCAWHDLWTDRDAGQPPLDFWHSRLLLDCLRFTEWQGAWSLDRTIRESLTRRGFRWMG